jgi:hypothetical protein
MYSAARKKKAERIQIWWYMPIIPAQSSVKQKQKSRKYLAKFIKHRNGIL